MHNPVPRLLTAILMCVSVAAQAAPDCAACRPGAANFDPASGLCFPEAISGMETVVRTEEDRAAMRAYRHTTVAGYNRPLHHLAITAFLYDREIDSQEADTKEVRALVAEILQVHAKANQVGEGRTTLQLAGAPAHGTMGMIFWLEDGDDIGSIYWLLPRGARYLKLRATYVRPHGGEGEAMAGVFKAVRTVAEHFCTAPAI